MDEALQQAFASFVGDPDASELSALILINRLLVPNLDVSAVERALQALVRKHDPAAPPWQFLRERGFRGNEDDYGALDNSRLDRLLETGQGIPISLAVLLIHLSRVSGHRACGINFPGHFLVRVDDTLVDPFRMEATSKAECLAGRPELARQPGADPFEVAGPAAVLLRMLNNLKFAFAGAMTWHRALDVVDAQVILVPGEPGLYLERGDYWRQLGVVSAAADAYGEALRLTEDRDQPRFVEIRQAAAARLQSLEGASDVFH